MSKHTPLWVWCDLLGRWEDVVLHRMHDRQSRKRKERDAKKGQR